MENENVIGLLDLIFSELHPISFRYVKITEE